MDFRRDDLPFLRRSRSGLPRVTSSRLVVSLLGVVLGAIGLSADVQRFAWPGNGALTLDIPDGWKIEGEAVDRAGYRFVARPESKVPAVLQLTVLKTTQETPVIEEELPERLRDSLESYLASSVEKECHPRPLRCRQGQGWYADLTDSALVGKPPAPDDYKVLRNALIALDEHTLVIATMQFDDPFLDEIGEMLAIVCSIRSERWPGLHSAKASSSDAGSRSVLAF